MEGDWVDKWVERMSRHGMSEKGGGGCYGGAWTGDIMEGIFSLFLSQTETEQQRP